jgi:Tol biopolymer transport system component/tRNA A-37 threonylcarbamoyl transferase component Bud32
MTGGRWSRIKEVYEAAVELPAAERETFIRRACLAEHEIAEEVLRLLRASEHSDDYLEHPLSVPAATEASETVPVAGVTIGHYEIIAKVGEGGMGQVFKARDPRLGRFVAIKVISPKRGDVAERTIRLLREARAASALNHPNIVTVYDIGTVPGSNPEAPFVVMEYVEGRTLRDLIADGEIPLKQRLGYAIQIADALAAAHASGIIHRDVKPANVMVNSLGLAKVLDFGLARSVVTESVTREQPATTPDTGDTVSQQLTKPGFVMGTPAYVSPEQVEGRVLDARSDIFSFGVLLYELLTGTRPFDGSTPMVLAAAVLRHTQRPVVELCPDAGGEIEQIVAKCLAKRPEDRFQQMAEAKAALEQARDALVTGKVAVTPARAYPGTILAGIVVAGLLGAFLAYYLLTRPEQPAIPWTAAPLTSYVGVERSPSFSPDGSQIAFSWNGEDRINTDIYVRPTKGGRYLRLTEHPHVDEMPAWSPDGQYIVFRRSEPGFGVSKGAKSTAILISPLGGIERVLAEGDIRFLGWTADSHEVGMSVQVARPEEGPNASRHALELVSVDTGARRRLIDPPVDTRGDVGFAFSPNGKWLALTRWAPSPATDVLVMPAGGGDARLLVRENVWTNGLAWTPDSRDIVLAASRDGRRRLWRVPAQRRGASTPQVLTGIEPDAAGPAIFAGRGNTPPALAFERHNDDVNIWRVDLDQADKGGNPRRLIDSTWRESSPAISADGKKLVFVSTRSGISELFTAGADGRNQGQLSRFEWNVGSPRWSPDGEKIVFDSFVGDNKELYLIGAAGQNLVRLTNEPKEEARPSWSPDGKWIYFRSARSGSAEIWRMPSNGGAAQQVTRKGGVEPLASMDGQWVFYIRDRRATELWRVPVGGGEEIKLLDGPVYGYWGVGRDGIYFVDQFPQNDGSRAVRMYDLKTGKVRAVAQVSGDIAPSLPGLSVSADGKVLILLQVERTEADLFLVPGFR